MERYSLDPSQVDTVINLIAKKDYDDMGAFNKEIVKLQKKTLKHSNPPLKYIGGFTKQDQKTGTCAWCSPKGAAGVFFRLYTNSLHDESREEEREKDRADPDRVTGKKIDKAFTLFGRKEALEKHLKSAHPNKELIVKILEKYIKKGQAKQTNHALSLQLEHLLMAPNRELILELLTTLRMASAERMKRLSPLSPSPSLTLLL